MADTKISELTEVTPIATDMVPVVSGGATRKAQLKNLRPYKIYVALLTQSGSGAPSAQELENTLGGSVVWTRTSTGDYTGTLSGAFTSSKTWCSSTGGATPAAAGVYFNRVDANSVRLVAAADSLLNGYPIEIRVYS